MGGECKIVQGGRIDFAFALALRCFAFAFFGVRGRAMVEYENEGRIDEGARKWVLIYGVDGVGCEVVEGREEMVDLRGGVIWSPAVPYGVMEGEVDRKKKREIDRQKLV